MAEPRKSIWVVGDYREYFQNRVTLQLLAKARELAPAIDAEVCAVVLGHGLDEYLKEYAAHGADRIYAVDHPSLEGYQEETYASLLERLAGKMKPEVILIGATDFGRVLAARAASRLGVGLTADCVELSFGENGILIQTAPAYGGNLLAEIIIPDCTPQMATVRPGIFTELPHEDNRRAAVEMIELPGGLGGERMRLVSWRKAEHQGVDLARARVVVMGGRGMGGKKRFAALHQLADLLGGEVGATRPAVYAGWADEHALVGQAGKHINPKLLVSFGISGAIQHTAGIGGAEFIVAVNKNPQANMMALADVGIVGDAHQVCLAMIERIKEARERTSKI